MEVEYVNGMVVVSDSKDPDGPKLKFSHEEWDTFTQGVRDGDFD